MPVAAQTRLYHPALAGYHPALAGTPPEEGNWHCLGGLFPTPLYHGSAELAECPASMQARACKCCSAIFNGSSELAERLASKSVTGVTARLLDLGRHILVSRETLT